MFGLFVVWCLPVLAVAFVWITVCEIIHICQKTKFYRNITENAEKNKFRVSKPRNVLSSIFRYSSTPDLIVEGAKEKYLIRYIDTFDQSKCFVFPTEEYYVSFDKIALTWGFDLTEKFKHLPKINERYLSVKDGQKLVKVLVFGPKIGKITALSDDLKSTQTINSGEVMFDWLAFDHKSFLEFFEKSSKF